jgi:hypothetical protein
VIITLAYYMLYIIGYLRLGGPNRLTGGGGQACDWGGRGPPGLYVKKGSASQDKNLP